MKNNNLWKARDARARLSELVRNARAGAPQIVMMRGKVAVVVVDAERFDAVPKSKRTRTPIKPLERSKK